MYMKKLMMLLVIASLSACGTTTGWHVEFGMSPITAVHDEKSLNQREIDEKGRFSTPTLAATTTKQY
jgi:hypothetical protein